MTTTIGLVQINNSFSQANYLPLAVGLLQAYAQAHSQRQHDLRFLLPVYCRMSVQRSVEHLLSADLVGFSAYSWNIRLSLAIAEELKRRRPETLIVFGGPQVPDAPEAFLREHRFIDLCVHGEGEVVFSQLLDTFEPGRWSCEQWTDLPSVSYLRGEQFVHQARARRLKDLNQIPSPYLGGVFEPLIAANPHQEWLGLWETNRGCPFSCTFCDWGSATQAKVYQFDMERLHREVEWFAEHKVEFIFCCDANFGILPRDLEIAEFVAAVKAKQGYPKALSVQNTKNATERAYQVQKTLADHGLNKGVTLSMQSMDPLTLKSIRRDNISLNSYQELQRRFNRDRIETYCDMILALPGETYDSFVDGVATLITNHQHNRIQFNNLSILPNAEMGNPEYQARYGMVTVQTRIVNIHGALSESEDGIYETQDLVIATNSMPAEDWVRTRSFAWMTALVHFDKLFQIPIILAHELGGVPYRDLLIRFAEASAERYPTLGRVGEFFRHWAREIQNGATEYVQSQEWLNIYWPADEYALIQLVFEGRQEDFYKDCEQLVADVLRSHQVQLPAGLLEQASLLNRKLLKLPFVCDQLQIELTYNLWDIYQGALVGEKVGLRSGHWHHRIDRSASCWNSWDEWCRQVVWFGNKKGAYLYGSEVREIQLEGHF